MLLTRHSGAETDASSELVDRRWEGDPGAYGPRRARAPFVYRASSPSHRDARPGDPFETHDVITAAEAAVSGLNADSQAIGLEAVGPLLLRSEAIASSRIDGYELSQRYLARALIDPRAARGTARTVAANVVAMEEAITLGESDAQASIMLVGERLNELGALRTTR